VPAPGYLRPAPGAERLADVPHSRLAVRHYHVIYNGLSQIWSWWVKLTDGQWIQSAGVAQTDSSGDCPVPHVPDC